MGLFALTWPGLPAYTTFHQDKAKERGRNKTTVRKHSVLSVGPLSAAVAWRQPSCFCTDRGLWLRSHWSLSHC